MHIRLLPEKGKIKFVANQLKKDKESEQLSIFDPRDPFTGSK